MKRINNKQHKKGETMKTKNLLLAVLFTAVPLSGFAQEWDDIYADPTQPRHERVTIPKEQDDPQKKKVVIVQGDASNMEVIANGRDVDEYNRRGNDTITPEEEFYSSEDENRYQEYEYTDRIVRFHDPQSSIKITGADEVIVYVGDDVYEGYNNRGWNSHLYMGWGSYYPWYDPWYYGGWYGWHSPWYYSRWHSPWYYGGWYDPWFYGGWHSPWYYSRWHSPWYYGGWYDPWHYGYGYGGGYYHGFHDGYYSSLPRNRSGSSSGTYRRSAANRTTATSAALSGRSSTRTRTALSGRTSDQTRTAISGRGATNALRTRIIDTSGRAYDSRTGRAIDRTGTTSRSSSVNRATQSTRSETGRYGTTTPSRTRSSSTYDRGTTTPSRNTYQR